MRVAVPSPATAHVQRGDVLRVLVDDAPARLEVLTVNQGFATSWLMVEVPSGSRVGAVQAWEQRS